MNTSQDKEQRAAILKKIRALMAETTERGATEAEAKIAAAKIDELLKEYDISRTEMGVKTGTCVERNVSNPTKRQHAMQRAIMYIGKFTDCECWMSANGVKGCTFFLFPDDVEVAEYLYYLFLRAIENESANYGVLDFDFAQLDPTSQHQARQSFSIGMADRLGERLLELKDKRDWAVKARTGRELVVVKGDEVARQMKAAGIRLGRGRGISARNAEGYDAGRSAGGCKSARASAAASVERKSDRPDRRRFPRSASLNFVRRFRFRRNPAACAISSPRRSSSKFSRAN